MIKPTLFLGLWAAGCATRAHPAEPAAGSPLSPTAARGTLPQVATALRGDPPLPGESTAGWEGLAPSEIETTTPEQPAAAAGVHAADDGSAKADDVVDALLRAPLTADGAVRVALLNNRDLRATLASVGIARGELAQAGVIPNPRFELVMHRAVGAADGHGDTLEKEIGVEIELSHTLLTGMRTDVALAELEAERLRAATEVIATGYRTRVAFYAYQAAQQRHAIAQRMLEAWVASREAARALFAAGNSSELDLATQEVAYEDARATAAEMELDMLDRREDLHQVLGVWGDATGWTVRTDLPPAPEVLALPADLQGRALAASLTVRETESRLRALGHRVGLSRAEGWLPEIGVTLNAEERDERWAVGGGLTFTLPVFDRQQGRVAAHEAAFDALNERLHGEAISLRSAARRVRQRALSAHARAKQYQEVILPARARVMAHTLLQYNAMQVGVFELLTNRRAQLEAELSYVTSLRELWSGQAAIDALLHGYAVPLARGGEETGATLNAGSSSNGGH